MNVKERTMAVLRGERPDRTPWLIYSVFLPRGFAERELRNMGLGLVEWVPVHKAETPNVNVEQKTVGEILHITYHTPVGEVSTKQRTGMDFASASDLGGVWTKEYVIKDLSDYDAVRFIVEDTVYRPNYEPFLKAERELGGDGVVATFVERSSLQRLLIELMGYRRFSIDLYRHPKEFEELLRTIDKKEEELYRIVADSPAEIVWCPDNINGIVTSPKLFEKYCVPFYNRQARLLHRKGKIYEVHMDGRLRCLLNLIQKAEIDVVEAFTPPPVGDLPLAEARAAWGDKYTIWINFPESVCLLGRDEVRRCTIELLKSAAPGDRFIMGVTEDIPPDILEVSLKTVTKTILKYGKYPLSPA